MGKQLDRKHINANSLAVAGALENFMGRITGVGRALL